MPIENLFDSSDAELPDNKNELNVGKESNQKEKIYIPDTCDVDILYQQEEYVADEQLVIRDTCDIGDILKVHPKLDKLKMKDHSTPKAIKKVLNEHGLDDLTNSPTIIESNVNAFAVNNKNNDKYDHLMDNIFKNDSSLENSVHKNDNDSLNFSLDFKKSAVQSQKKMKSDANRQDLIVSPANKRRLKQITMTQAFDNYRFNSNSQSKENFSASTAVTSVNSTTSSSSIQRQKIDLKPKKVLTENRDINKKLPFDPDDEIFLLESQNNKAKQRNAIHSKFKEEIDFDSNTNNEDDNDEEDDDDELIFDFDKPPKKRTNSPKYKHVQVIKKQNERKKLTPYSCLECENVLVFLR